MITYIKKDIVEKTAAQTGLEVRDAAKVVNAVFASLIDLMDRGEPECRIEIRNFGVFEVKVTAARPKARNPRKPNELIYIPPRLRACFRPGKTLKTILQKPLREK